MCVALVGVVALAVSIFGSGETPELAYSFLRDPDFWVATGTNCMGMGLFLTRVHAHRAARWFGYGTQLFGIPALALGLSDVLTGTTDLSTWANLGYAAWAAGAAFIDHVLDIEYRDPVRPAILIPYVVTYYIAVGSQAAVLLDKDVTPWAIAGIACIANAAASIYARAHEAD